MAFWRKSEPNYEQIQRILQQDPGLSVRELARRTNMAPSTILRCLPGMEEAGYLLYEDDHERLWPFGRDK